LSISNYSGEAMKARAAAAKVSTTYAGAPAFII